MNNNYKISDDMIDEKLDDVIDEILDELEDIAKYYNCSIEEAMELSIESLKKRGN